MRRGQDEEGPGGGWAGRRRGKDHRQYGELLREISMYVLNHSYTLWISFPILILATPYPTYV